MKFVHADFMIVASGSGCPEVGVFKMKSKQDLESVGFHRFLANYRQVDTLA